MHTEKDMKTREIYKISKSDTTRRDRCTRIRVRCRPTVLREWHIRIDGVEYTRQDAGIETNKTDENGSARFAVYGFSLT